MTIKDRLQKLIFDFEKEINQEGLSFPPGISKVSEKENEEALLLLRSAFEILEGLDAVDFAIENLNFKEQQEVYYDLAFYSGASDKETAFISLREKSKHYSELQKILAHHEFLKLMKP